jgi:hypothetical protein
MSATTVVSPATPGARDIPLAGCADGILARLAAATNSPALAALDGATLLGERAMLGGMTIPGRTSAGGGCHFFDALDDTVALNLARPADRELLPALFATDSLDYRDEQAISALIAQSEAAALVGRGRSMGLAIAAGRETASADACVELTASPPRPASTPDALRVLDLSALWAGPLACHLLSLAGASVKKVESITRPDAMRDNSEFYALLNQGKSSVALDLKDSDGRRRLLSLIAASDIVIESARPRALMQLGIDAGQLVSATPGLVWVTITGHGVAGEAANWVGFGDDCGVAGGLSAALLNATGQMGFVGDAIADPLTGMTAALVAWEAWASRRGGRFVLSMSQIVAQCVAEARTDDPVAFQSSLLAWSAAVGQPFPTVNRRHIGELPEFGSDTRKCVAGNLGDGS